MRILLALGCCWMAACSRQAPPSAEKTASAPPPQYFQVDPATAGKVSGQVRFTGKVPPAKRISMDAEEACQKLHPKPVLDARVTKGKQNGLANVFVYVKSGLEGKTFEPPKTSVVLDQRGCMFVPRVLGLQTGQTLQVKNSDPVTHSVHPMPQNSREWNQQQAPGAEDLERKIVRSEVMIPVKCNVHSWMHSYLGAVDHPYFAVTDESGSFSLENLPSGEYVVAAWHETLGERTERVTIAAREGKTVAIVFQ